MRPIDSFDTIAGCAVRARSAARDSLLQDGKLSKDTRRPFFLQAVREIKDMRIQNIDWTE
jgi:hypothetical protein